MSKPRVIKDYDKIDETLISQIKLNYPRGYEKYLVKFQDAKGKFVSALPFETDDRYYLIRMTVAEAQEIVEDDDDYDEDGHLKPEAIEGLEDELGEGLDDDIELDGMDDDDEVEITLDDVVAREDDDD